MVLLVDDRHHPEAQRFGVVVVREQEALKRPVDKALRVAIALDLLHGVLEQGGPLCLLEESLVLFRTHHARMVERIIGRRVGTGGSSGVDYLDATLKYRVFNDLWTVRTLLIKKESLPGLINSEFYGFAGEVY